MHQKIYHRARGRIISQQQYSVTNSTRNPEKELYYAYDSLGSLVSLSDRQGHTATRYRYNSFDELTEGDISENEYTYTGQRLDPESRLYHFHFRQYDATASVWTTTDPIGILGGLNLYGYVQNNPLNYRDILGLGRDPDEDGYNDCCGAGDSGSENANHGNDGNSRNDDHDTYNLPEVVVTAKKSGRFLDGGRNDDHDSYYIQHNPVMLVDPRGMAKISSGGIVPTIEKHTAKWFKNLQKAEKFIAGKVFRGITGLPGPTGPQALGLLLRGAGGAILWELTHPTEPGDGTLPSWDLNGNKIPDLIEAPKDDC